MYTMYIKTADEFTLSYTDLPNTPIDVTNRILHFIREVTVGKFTGDMKL